MNAIAVLASAVIAAGCGALELRPESAGTLRHALAGRADPESAAVAEYSLSRGRCAVKMVDVTIHDAARKKDIELRVRIPQAETGGRAPEAGWPLVVFSHGAGGSRTAFPDLLEFWGTHGYATIAITHSDSIELGRRNGEGGVGQYLSPEGRRKLLSKVDLGERVRDCVFVLDHLEEIAAAAAQAGGTALRVDLQKLGVAGHSAGAFTTELCAGVKVRGIGVGRAGEGFVSVAEPRFKVAIVISGQGTKAAYLGQDSWNEVKIPMYVLTGSLDASPPQMGRETPESRQEPYYKSRGTAQGGPPAYLMFIEGATHSSYAGKAASGLLGEKPATDAKVIGAAVATGTTLFLDSVLRSDAEARRTLESDRMARTIVGKVRFEHK